MELEYVWSSSMYGVGVCVELSMYGVRVCMEVECVVECVGVKVIMMRGTNGIQEFLLVGGRCGCM